MASDPASPAHHVRQLVRLQPGRPALMLGVRTALATVVPLLLAPWIGHVASAWASTGGFTVALADKGGSYRTRALTMGGITLAAALSVVAGAFVAPYGWAAAPLMFVLASLCAFAGVLGAAAASGGVTVGILFAVSLASPPASTEQALLRGVAIVGAGVWAMALALLFWPIRVYKPARYAVARADRALAAHARQIAKAAAALLPSHTGDQWMAELVRGHGAIRDAVEQARVVLAATRRGRLGESGRGARLLVLLQAADQSFATLVALEEMLDASPARAAAARALVGFATALETIADRTEPEGRLPPPPPVGFDGAELHAAGDEHAALLVERLHWIVDTAFDTTASLHEERPPQEALATPAMALVARADAPRLGDELRANLTVDSVLARHALRVGATTAIAVAVSRALGLQRGYWVTLTVLIILQPYRNATFTKALQRVAGTVGGAVVAALLLTTLRSADALLVVATLFAGVSAAVLQLNYALFAFFLTPTFVLLAELGARDWHLAEVRIVNTLLGGVLAFAAARIFWPHRERERFADALGHVLTALADYVGMTARALTVSVPAEGPAMLPPVRRALGLKLNAAEASFERVLAERGVSREAQEALMTMLLYARRLGATLGALVSVRAVAPFDVDPAALDALADAASAWLRALADAVAADRPPPAPPELDPLMRPFAGTLFGARLERLRRQLAVLQGAAARAAGKVAESHA